ncbi:MAG: type II 3-dehydroquinate dehydratase [Candidatus Krumholzibacteriia bacterium]
MSDAIPVSILNGPNLDQLGRREPELYGSTRWPELVALCRQWSAAAGLRAEVEQVDGEGELVARLHAAGRTSAGIVLNAAAYTHTSVALRDGLLCLRVPVVEVHLTNPMRREPFRRTSLIADVVTATVQGFGTEGYRLAIEGLASLLRPSC